MEKHFYKSSGVSLIFGAFLMIVTMVLHPAGGSIEYIIKISSAIIIAHSLAIFSIPLLLFGFYGLSLRLLDKWKLSMLAFIILSFGLVAAMFAALLNGLSLPYFLHQYSKNLDENIEVLSIVARYGFAINTALDYIFIIAASWAILIYSILILLDNIFPKWLAYLGIFIVIFALIGGLTGFDFIQLNGFRYFVFSIAAWILSSSFLLINSPPKVLKD